MIFKYSKNIFEEGELVRDSVVAQNATTAADWKTYMVDQQYRQRIDQQPSEVDKHPAEAIEKLGKIEGKAKP